MKNHFYYQRITHNFYKAVRNLEIISYYIGNEYFSSKEIYFLEDQNTPHYQMFLTKYSHHTRKIKDIEVNLFYYEAFFFVLQSKRLFNIELLPHPEGPIIPTNSLLYKSNDISFIAVVSPFIE